MASGVYITATEGLSGKSTVALGIIDALAAKVSNVGVFRPVARTLGEPDYVLELLLSHDAISPDYERCVGVGYDDVHRDPDQALSEIVRKYRELDWSEYPVNAHHAFIRSGHDHSSTSSFPSPSCRLRGRSR